MSPTGSLAGFGNPQYVTSDTAPFRRSRENMLATMASVARSTEAKARAEATFKKEERAKEGAKAMVEYQANGRAVRERMAQLKAMRMAREAADKKLEPAPGAAGKR
jgi:hypothetical protein